MHAVRVLCTTILDAAHCGIAGVAVGEARQVVVTWLLHSLGSKI